MKKAILFAIILVLMGGVSLAGALVVTVEWDPPTTRIANNVCTEIGTPLTPEEIMGLQYTVKYRVKGTTDWTIVEVGAPRIALTGLAYSTTYVLTSTAHFVGGPATCPSDVFTFTTPAAPPPGGCKGHRVTFTN